MRESARRKQGWFVAAVASVVLTGIAMADSTQAAKTSGSRAEVEATLAGVATALTRGDSAEKITNMMYADNILIVEPGTDPATRGLKATTKAVQEWMDSLGPGGVKDCRYTIIDPVVATARTFSSFLQMFCKANGTTNKEDMNLRLVYVWEKRPQGWRVVLESVNEGKF